MLHDGTLDYQSEILRTFADFLILVFMSVSSKTSHSKVQSLMVSTVDITCLSHICLSDE